MTTSCNLQCKYCIEKKSNKAWSISHPQDYSIYIDKLLELNIKNKETLEAIELLGGEPLLGMLDFINFLPQFIETFPNLHEIRFSTNGTFEQTSDLIKMLTRIIAENTDRQFDIKIQLSVDGPKELNDNNRGTGTTEALLKNMVYYSIFNNVHLKVNTNSTFYRQNLFSFISYEDVENWFNFFLNNFPENVQFGLFRPAKEVFWNKDDGIRFAQILNWANEWKDNHPEEAKRFIWSTVKNSQLTLCAAGVKGEAIAMSPNGDLALCYLAALDGNYITENTKYESINLTNIYDYLMDQYVNYKDTISVEDYRKSLNIYISDMWCPYWANLKDIFGPKTWFMRDMPLYYNGAMNILMQWSDEYGQG